MAAVAALVLLVLNLYLALQNAHTGDRPAGRERDAVEAVAARIRQDGPGLTATEARRQAVLVVASEHATPRPDPASLWAQLLFTKEDATWDTH
jgi:hypothetical protein